ncbi:MAG: glycogen synthase GlgA, partial [Betaproteobacteria bacterium]
AILGSDAPPLSFRPDIVHCNDWQSALAPALLHYAPGKKAKTVMTIHNLAFQGIFPAETFDQSGLPPESFNMEGVEYYGNFSFLKAGLYYADHITTVSPTYAREIQREPLGFGMQGLLAKRRANLTGIVNGIDTHDWNPAVDPHLAQNYDAATLTGKAANKRALQERMGLAPDPDVPLLGVISRITHQKGVDLLLEIAPRLLAEPAQIVLLGTGDAELENGFRRLALAHPGKTGIMIGFDEGLSHLIEAGADLFLMPSRFEPCGLNQMYSQRYGTPPVVHATGGLADTVADGVSGFLFEPMTAEGFYASVQRALAAYRDNKAWRQIQRNGMKQDFSWKKSAEDYLALYGSI